jgi:catechol 2,3-dioxygenase-like lactoylglutathione lyase family enzyme
VSPALTHVAFHVDDLEASTGFYRRYCGLHQVHARDDGTTRVVWLSEPGKDTQFVFVLISGGATSAQAPNDYSHLGFAVESRERVDEIAERARADGILLWAPTDNPYPVGYYCGVKDPNGQVVEFSFGQPLGEGAAAAFANSDSH